MATCDIRRICPLMVIVPVLWALGCDEPSTSTDATIDTNTADTGATQDDVIEVDDSAGHRPVADIARGIDAADGADVDLCATVVCKDADPCTLDQCDPKTAKCEHPAAADGSQCGQDLACSAGLCGPVGMRLVPAGKFWQGCNEVAEGKVTCQYDEYPQHEVFVSGFWFDVYTVSVSQYAECVTAAVCDKPKWLHGVAKEHAELYNWGAKGRDKHPINGVTWHQAKTYCTWRHKGGRLATESEWEKTARGGCDVNKGASCKAAMRAYPWGNAKPTCTHAVVSNDGQARQTDFGCGKGTTWPVGAKPTDVGPYGHRGLAGNVSEWIDSCYIEDYYEQFASKLAVNPKPKCVDDDGLGVRGGGFYDPGFDSRASYRHAHPPDSADYYVGIRCARDK